MDREEYWDLVEWQDLERTTAEGVCIAAAEAVFPTLPADVRAKLGERP